MKSSLTFGSLFSGIGGMDLGLERAGLQCRWQVEINEYACRVLAKHWPSVRRHGDVRTFPPDDGLSWGVDLIAGGFPCQDISLAGKGKGLDGVQSSLWFEFIRIIRVIRPRFVLVENSPGLFVRGFGRVLGGLAQCGYDAEWSIVSACSMGATHMRKRLFILAYTEKERRKWRWNQGEGQAEDGRGSGKPQGCLGRSNWSLETRPPIERMAHGFPNRVDRLEGFGNAVVPQVAEWIGRRIVESIE